MDANALVTDILVEARGSQRGPGIAMRLQHTILPSRGNLAFLQVSSLQGQAAASLLIHLMINAQ